MHKHAHAHAHTHIRPQTISHTHTLTYTHTHTHTTHNGKKKELSVWHHTTDLLLFYVDDATAGYEGGNVSRASWYLNILAHTHTHTHTHTHIHTCTSTSIMTVSHT